MKNLPEGFISLMQDLLGIDESSKLIDSLEQEPPVSIRLSNKKGHWYNKSLDTLMPIPWCSSGYYLDKRPIFTGDAAFHGGVYYVQEASSMLLYQIRKLLGNTPLVALDLCAAPGGKSTLLLDILPEGSTLVANEIVKHRANILCENILKWGNPNVIVTNTNPKSIGKLSSQFDVILVDAPCSGEGMFRKDIGSRKEWSSTSTTFCASRQKEILLDIWDSLNDNGILIYSTCTMNTSENEDIVEFIVDTFDASPIDLGTIDGGVWQSPFTRYSCYRMMPHRISGEGLFMAVFKKMPLNNNLRSRQKKSLYKPPLIPKYIYNWIKDSETYKWDIQSGDVICAYPDNLTAILEQIRSQKIPILCAGIPVAVMKGKNYIPHPALALSTEIHNNAFDLVELTEQQVIPYLSREAISISTEISVGIKLVHYKRIPLGFIKHLGNRSNNMYPQEWRIRHSSKIQEEWNESLISD